MKVVYRSYQMIIPRNVSGIKRKTKFFPKKSEKGKIGAKKFFFFSKKGLTKKKRGAIMQQ